LKRYRFLADAESEFHEQIAYYDAEARALGDKFIADVYAVVSEIRQYPESGARVSRNVRKRVLTTFKYNILYVAEEKEIVIVAIAPHRKRPNYWRKRLRKTR
jgi:toxin ParE1/3/4